MKYANGDDIKPGDLVRIDTRYLGRVVACVDTGTCLPGYEGWNYLDGGIMVDTDFGGLVHYRRQGDADDDELVLVRRDGTTIHKDSPGWLPSGRSA